MNKINTYRDLLVWQKSMNLVTSIYQRTATFPQSENYGLTSQIRRCAISIPSNIAEGYGRNSTGDYKRFLRISVGSLFELQTQIEIAFNLKYISNEVFQEMLSNTNELDRMLGSLISKIKD
jgi:four helix bundle protein